MEGHPTGSKPYPTKPKMGHTSVYVAAGGNANIRMDGWMDGWMSRSCFRSSPHHGRRTNGALVMMVLSKGIDRVNLDTRSESPVAWCSLVAGWQRFELWSWLWKKEEKRENRTLPRNLPLKWIAKTSRMFCDSPHRPQRWTPAWAARAGGLFLSTDQPWRVHVQSCFFWVHWRTWVCCGVGDPPLSGFGFQVLFFSMIENRVPQSPSCQSNTPTASDTRPATRRIQATYTQHIIAQRHCRLPRHRPQPD